MLAKTYRLAKRSDFDHLFKCGKKINSSIFIARYVENGLGKSRFTAVVSNKISKKATERNKLKRRFREVIKSNLSNFSQDYDLLISVLPAVAKLNYQELKERTIETLKKHQIINNNE
ncbi:MAG: ribonuclease P protein component [Patescibacteria group bacterium]